IDWAMETTSRVCDVSRETKRAASKGLLLTSHFQRGHPIPSSRSLLKSCRSIASLRRPSNSWTTRSPEACCTAGARQQSSLVRLSSKTPARGPRRRLPVFRRKGHDERPAREAAPHVEELNDAFVQRRPKIRVKATD